MAKIYMGNQEAADRGLLEALRRLGDNYHVFVEFQIPSMRGQRQVDFLVIREDPTKPCMFCLEVKMERRRLRGTINGPWEFEEAPGVWRILPVSNPRDQNPVQQAYNTARAMQAWMASMRALIQSPEQPWPDVPTVFPRLVLPVAHPDNQLQTDSFTWRFDGYDRCLDSLTSFIPRDPVFLGQPEIERLARHLGVQRLPDAAAPEEEEPDLPAWLRTHITRLADEIAGLRQEMRDLRLQLGRAPSAPVTTVSPAARYVPAAPAPRPTPEPGRDLDVAYRVLTEVVRDLRNAGRKMVFPNVQEGLWRRLGQFDVEQYGFFKFKEFLQEAERRRLVRLSVIDGVDYVSLPGEEPQVAPVGTPSNLEDLTPDERIRFIDSIAQLESRSAYMIRSYIARHITASGVLDLPMYEVRALVNDAVARGLFQRGSRPFRHPATGELQSLETLTLNNVHPWVAEALVQPGEVGGSDAPPVGYPAHSAWNTFPTHEGDWNGNGEWSGPDSNGGSDDAVARPTGQVEQIDAVWAAPDEATTDAGEWTPSAADWQANNAPTEAETDHDDEGWVDHYTFHHAAWSLSEAEAALHGPDADEGLPTPLPAPINGSAPTSNGYATPADPLTADEHEEPVH